MGTSVERSHSITDLSQLGRSFDIPGERVDGMDVRAVHAAGKRAAAHARGGDGPMILEMITYRYRGHSMSDPAKYRSRDEVQKIRTEHDPIEQVRQRLVSTGEASEDDLKQIDKEIRAIVNEAAEFSQQAPEPDPSELWTDVTLPSHA
jgi:pyruvate dehydrogenase E1 component alpha subunit